MPQGPYGDFSVSIEGRVRPKSVWRHRCLVAAGTRHSTRRAGQSASYQRTGRIWATSGGSRSRCGKLQGPTNNPNYCFCANTTWMPALLSTNTTSTWVSAMAMYTLSHMYPPCCIYSRSYMYSLCYMYP